MLLERNERPNDENPANAIEPTAGVPLSASTPAAPALPPPPAEPAPAIDTLSASHFGAVFSRSTGAARREAIAHPIAVTLGGEVAGTWVPVGISLEEIELPEPEASSDAADAAEGIKRYRPDPEAVELARIALEVAELRADFEEVCARLTRTPVSPDFEREAIARRVWWATVRQTRAQTQVDRLLEAVKAGINEATPSTDRPDQAASNDSTKE